MDLDLEKISRQGRKILLGGLMTDLYEERRRELEHQAIQAIQELATLMGNPPGFVLLIDGTNPPEYVVMGNRKSIISIIDHLK